MIAPILEELAVEQSDKFTIGKLDVDVNVATATKFSVMSIPTLLLFKDGEVVARLVGAKPKGAMLQEISRTCSSRCRTSNRSNSVTRVRAYVNCMSDSPP